MLKNTRSSSTLIFFVLLGLLVLPPLFSGGRDYRVIGCLLISSSFLIYWFFSLPPEQKQKLSGKKWTELVPLWLWLLALLALLLTIFKSVSIYDSFNYYFQLLAYFILFVISSQVVFAFRRLKIFALSILGSGVILSLIGVYYYVFGEYYRFISTFFWPNPFAGYLLFALPISLGLLLEARERTAKLFSYTVSILLCSAFILTQSRGAYLSFILPLMILIWIFRKKPKKELLIKSIILLSGVLLLVNLLFCLNEDSFSFFFLARDRLADEKDVSLTLREDYWQGALDIFKNYPLLGSGLNTFKTVYPSYQKNPVSFSQYVHNHYLQMLAETGVIGSLPFFLLFLSIAWLGIKLIKINQSSPGKTYAIFLFCGILGSLIHSLIDFDWYFSANFISFWILSGLVYGFCLNESKLSSTGNRNQNKGLWDRILLAFLGILGLVLVLRGATQLLADWRSERAEKFQAENNLEKSLKEYRKSVILNPNPDYLRKTALILYLKKNLNQAATITQQAIRLSSRDSANYYLLGKIYLSQQDLQQAETNFQKAIKLNPFNHLEYYLDLVFFYLRTQQIDKADHVISSALNNYPEKIIQHFKDQEKEIAWRLKTDESKIDLGHLRNLSRLYQLKADISLRQGNKKQAKELLDKSMEIKKY